MMEDAGNETRQGGRDWLRVVAAVVGLLALSGGLWGWKRWQSAHGGGAPAVWLLAPGKIQGRVVRDLEVELKKSPGKGEMRLYVRGHRGPLFSKSNMVGLSVSMGAASQWDSFLMMDGQDRVYMGWPSGRIQCWDGATRELQAVNLSEAQEEAVRVAYEQKTGQLWPRKGGLMLPPGP